MARLTRNNAEVLSTRLADLKENKNSNSLLNQFNQKSANKNTNA